MTEEKNLKEWLKPIFSMDLHSSEIFSSDMSLESLFSSDGSTGYLEDAIAADNWSYGNKRQRIESFYSHDQMIHQDLDDHVVANPCMMCTSMATQFVEDDFFMNDQSTPIVGAKGELYSTSSNSQIGSYASKISDSFNDSSISKGYARKIIYPFEVVKPGGSDGDITLRDINRRLLMRPSKPVRHPVGGSPTSLSPDGLGLSGKAIVALTKIHTQGRGTITVVKTKV